MAIRFRIKGKPWRAVVLSDKTFHKHDQNSDALCELPPDRRILIRKSAVNYPTILHELCHAMKSECCTESSDLDPSQTEELMCEVFAEHGEELIALAKSILKSI
jgi:hypothetical protein